MKANDAIRWVWARVFAALLISLLCAAGARAQQGSGRGGQGQDATDEEAEALRAQLLEMVDAAEEAQAAAGMGELGKDLSAITTNARTRIESAQLDELKKLKKSVPEIADLKKSVDKMKDTVQKHKKSAGKARSWTKSANLPSAPYSPLCGSNRMDSSVVQASEAALFVAEGVKEAASRACEETVVALGEGGNGSLACIATDLVYIAAKTANFVLTFCDGDIDSAEIEGSYDRLGHIHADLEASVSNDNANKIDIKNAIASQTASLVASMDANTSLIVGNDNANKAAILANSDANKTAIIANANANKTEVINVVLRTQIEADLAQPDSAVSVGLFMIPGAVCLAGQCGQLDRVRDVVGLTIDGLEAAGQGVGQARTLLAQGEAAKAAGRFKDAYATYKKAYKAAVK